MSLPALGQFSYNGFNFSEKCWTNAVARLLYDQADRTVVAAVWTLTAHQIVQSNTAGATDIALASAEQILSKPGQALVYQNNGFGGLNVNLAGVKDVMWGPKPRVIALRRLGASNAVELVWTCEFAIPMCSNALYQNALMAFNYTVNFTIDRDGLTQRTIKGYYEIPMTRIGGGTSLPDHADNYWPQVFSALTLPPGFDRRVNSREFSEDKRRCDFQIVDNQIPGPGGGYPVNITSWSGNQDIESLPKNQTAYFSTLSATYLVAEGVLKSAAFDAFVLLLQDRFSQCPQKSQCFISFKASEGLGDDRKCSFSMTWYYVSSISACLNDGGMFRTVPGTTWQAWIASPGAAAAKGQRGSAGLFTNQADDSIIDLCEGSGSTLTSASTSTLVGAGNNVSILQGINPEYSWLEYECHVEVLEKNTTSVLKSVPTQQPSTDSTGSQTDSLLTNQPTSTSTLVSSTSPIPQAYDQGTTSQLVSNTGIGQVPPPVDVVQNRAQSSYRIALVGHALRAGYKIPYPSLLQYQGQACTQQRAWTKQGTVANWGGVPVYLAHWRIEYIVAGPPTAAGIPVPANPSLQTQ